MFIAIILIFLALVFFGVIGHISKAANVGCGYATFYTLAWIGSVIWLCCKWGSVHGFWGTLGAMSIAFVAPVGIHLLGIIIKEFVVWALKGLGE